MDADLPACTKEGVLREAFMEPMPMEGVGVVAGDPTGRGVGVGD